MTDDRMRNAVLIVLLHVSPLPGGVAWALAQEPPGPRPVQPARPLTLPTFRPPVADTGIFSPLLLPQANELRRPSGAPGPRYWQQRVDYAIKVTLDTTAKRISGTESIRYTNNSPDTLRFIWMQLDQNLFRPGSTGSLLFPPDSRGAGFKGGFEIERVSQCVRAVTTRRRRSATARAQRTVAQLPPCPAVSLKTRVDDTMMYADLGRPIPPGGSTVLEVTFAFNVPEHGADRMGREGSLYEVAQWYPRLAVYDDVHGWNTSQYLGQGEFYLEYGDIEYEITLPAGFIVAGTGVLQNPAEVLTAAQQARLAAALKSDSTIRIVTSSELSSGAARPRSEGSMTWRFRAGNVRDVAWAASPQYLWDAVGWEGVLAQAYYRPLAAEIWKDAAKMSRYSIQEYSLRWLRYPYPQISAVEGPVSGTGYPMVAMEAKGDSAADLYRGLTHEIGHMWYPMIVGSDERRHAWMDEGFDTFINTFSEEGYWKRDDAASRQAERELVTRLDQTPGAQPILTPANRYKSSSNLLSSAYIKPSVMLLALRNKVLGAEVFDSAFREYSRRWAFKHPQPADFFRTVEEVSGRDLAWFWRGFFYTTSALDQSVESVKQMEDGSTQVTLASLGDAVMPVELELGFEDDTTELVKLPVEIWYAGNRYVYEARGGKAIVRAQVNPDGTFPDAVNTNDTWQRPDQAKNTATDEGR
ncbi:MAG TPA: M1 family metallopeptidase [Gemmatimonadales bacterium]|nr:M1 family metallopeptidase [Gemmatimonadales bacterium]